MRTFLNTNSIIFGKPFFYKNKKKIELVFFVQKRAITDKVNALQGVYLFLIMVIWRHHVRRNLAGRTIFGWFRFPVSWERTQAQDDTELNLIDREGTTNIGFEQNEGPDLSLSTRATLPI